MANYTANYNLKKPLGNENYDVENQNANMEIIDGEFKKVNDKVDAIKVPSNPSDIGAETPTGAQEKANTAETNAKAYTDTKIEIVNASLDKMEKQQDNLAANVVFKASLGKGFTTDGEGIINVVPQSNIVKSNLGDLKNIILENMTIKDNSFIPIEFTQGGKVGWSGTGSTEGIGANSTYKVAVRFYTSKAVSSGRVNVAFNGYSSSNTGNVKFTLVSSNAGGTVPNSSDIYGTVTIPCSEIPSTQSTNKFNINFDLLQPLLNGPYYFVIIETTSDFMMMGGANPTSVGFKNTYRSARTSESWVLATEISTQIWVDEEIFTASATIPISKNDNTISHHSINGDFVSGLNSKYSIDIFNSSNSLLKSGIKFGESLVPIPTGQDIKIKIFIVRAVGEAAVINKVDYKFEKDLVEELPYIFGTYTGNEPSEGITIRTIELGFRPSAVIVFPSSGFDSGMAGGMAIDGYPAKSGTTIGIEIKDTGFTVTNNGVSITNYNIASMNPYRYIAYR